MILRNVTVSPERERLRPPRAAELMPPIQPLERQKPRLEVLPDPLPAPTLTAEGVCEWLQAQSTEVRGHCAKHLATDLDLLTERAVELGREAGRKQGREEVLEGVKSGLAALSQAVDMCERAFATECEQLAESCAEIVAEAFRKLAGPALVTPDAALCVVLEVLERVKDERSLTIRVSAQDLPFLESQTSAIQEALGAHSWTLCADPRVAVGGCLVETALGTLDGRLETQLQELWETLRAAKTSRLEEQ